MLLQLWTRRTRRTHTNTHTHTEKPAKPHTQEAGRSRCAPCRKEHTTFTTTPPDDGPSKERPKFVLPSLSHTTDTQASGSIVNAPEIWTWRRSAGEEGDDVLAGTSFNCRFSLTGASLWVQPSTPTKHVHTSTVLHEEREREKRVLLPPASKMCVCLSC